MDTNHRWSGWPGAWCQDCGIEDQREICCNECDWIDRAMECEAYGFPPIMDCEFHRNRPCLGLLNEALMLQPGPCPYGNCDPLRAGPVDNIYDIKLTYLAS